MIVPGNSARNVVLTPYGRFGGDNPARQYVNFATWRQVALDAARPYGGLNGFKGFTAKPVFEMPIFSFEPGYTFSEELRTPLASGIARSDELVEVLVWPHRRCFVKEYLSASAESLGLVRIIPFHNALCEIDTEYKHILPNTPFAENPEYRNPPNGWIHDGPGETHLWQRYWQFQPGLFSRVFARSRFDVWRTFLIAFGATWHYQETDDYESRIGLGVFSLPECGDYHWKDIKRHRAASEQLAQLSYNYLLQFPATAESLAVRRTQYNQLFVPAR